jgi:molecular chaperone GrpE
MTQERQTDNPEQTPEQWREPVAEPAAATEDSAPAVSAGEDSRERAGAGEIEPPEQWSAMLEDARAKADENWDLVLRARAELENLKRRHANELERAHKFALDGFVRELLQVRDSLELGYSAASGEGASVEKLLEGTELTLKLLTDVMGKFGVEQLDPQGEPFNPQFQQAMTMQPREDISPNTVVTVVQKGYLLNGRLVRPAMVIVSAPVPEQS